MRIVNYQNDVVNGISHLLGIDPTIDLAPDRARQWNSFINKWVRAAWRFYDWPELRVTEERAYRTIWNSTKTFKRVGANGLPDELFYIPTFLYYKVLSTAPGDPPAGTLPTNTTYFAVFGSPDQYIDLDQNCRQAIGEVIGVYNGNPLTAGGAGVLGLDHRLSQRGIEIAPVGLAGVSAFVTFKIRHSVFTTDPYVAATAYVPGNLVFWTDGNCYRNISASSGVAPPFSSTWALVPMPERISEFVKLAAASDASDDLQTSGKLLTEAQELLRAEVDALMAQGDVHFYPRGDMRRLLGLPIGMSGFWWSVSAPWTAASSSSTTTLTDACFDAGGSVTVAASSNLAEGAVTALISGQDYVDLVFAINKGTTEWNFTQLEVEYPTDPPPLKIWPTIVAARTATGCRVYLNAAPDDANYKLRWRAAP